MGSIKPFQKQITPIAQDVEFDTNSISGNGFPDNIDNVQSAIEYAKQNAEGFPRAGIALISNGTLSDNEWISYNELVATTKILMPVNTKLHEITWDNAVLNVSFDLEFYKNGTSPSNIFYTYSTRNNASGYGIISGLTYTFNAGDYIRIKYKDFGTNAADLVVVLWISRII